MTDMTQAGRRIAAPLDTVVRAVTELEAYPSWAHEVTAVEVMVRDARGMPKRARLTFAAGALRDDVVLDYVVTRRGTEATMAWQLVSAEHLVGLQGSYELAAAGEDSTDVTYRISVDPGLPLHTALRTKMQARIIDAALDALERYVVAA